MGVENVQMLVCFARGVRVTSPLNRHEKETKADVIFSSVLNQADKTITTRVLSFSLLFLEEFTFLGSGQ